MTISIIAEIDSARARTGAAEFNASLATMRTGVATTIPSIAAVKAGIASIGTAATTALPVAAAGAQRAASGFAAVRASASGLGSVLAATGSGMASAASAIGSGAMAAGGALGGLGRAVLSLQGLFLGLAAGAIGGAAKAALAAGDNFATLSARIGNVAKEGTSAAALLGGIADAANRARAPVGELADLYRRNAEALNRLGFSEAQGIRLAESLAKVTKVSGVSAGEASAAMMQLSQAIVSGKFQGDEFRSVAENMPEVLRILEKQLGKTAKELRDMAEAGQLSGKLLAQALLNAGGSIDEKFSRLPKTVGEAFSQLTSQISMTFGEIMAQSGASQRFAEIFDGLRASIASPTFATAARATGSALSFVGESLKSVGAFASEARVQVIAWTTAISETAVYKTFAAGVDLVSGAFGKLRDAAGGAISAVTSTASANAIQTDLGRRAAQIAEETRALSALRGSMVPAKSDVITAAANPDKPEKLKLEESALHKEIRLARESEALKKQILDAELAGDGAKQRALELQLDIHGRITEEMRKKEGSSAKALEAAIRETDAAKLTVERAKIARDLATDRMENDLTRAEIAGNRDLSIAISDQLAIRKGITAEMRAQHPELAKQKEGEILITEELRRQKETRAQLNQFGSDLARSMVDGIKGGIAEGKKFADVVASIGSKVVDLTLEFLVLKPLVESIGRSMGGFMSGAGITNGADPLGIGGLFGGGATAAASAGGGGGLSSMLSSAGSLFGFANGAAFDSPVALAAAPSRPFKAFAAGDVFSSPVALDGGGWRGVMAEAGPEAIMPLTRMPGGKLGVQAAGGGRGSVPQISPNINISISVAGDATEQTIAKFRQAAREEIARATPSIVRNSVGAVADEHRANGGYLRR